MLVLFLTKKGTKLLLLDLDETLVHTEQYEEGRNYDFVVDFGSTG